MKKSTNVIQTLKGDIRNLSVLIFAVLLAFSLGFVSCSSDSDDDDGGSGKSDITQITTKGSNPVRSASVAATSSSVVLAWAKPSDTSNYGGVKIAWDTGSYTADADTTTYTVSSLSAGTSYTFTLTTLDSKNAETSSVVTITLKTPSATAASGSVSGDPMKIALTVPEDATNTTLTVTATITTDGTVQKVVYKKDGSINAATLLADEDATAATADGSDNSKWTFTLTATDETSNGTYTVAAIDSVGREETASILINNFDFTAPANVTGVSATYDSENSTITLKWTDSTDDDFDHVLISYITNDGTSDSEASETVSVDAGTQTYTLENVSSEVQYYKFTIKSVDSLGNTSSGRVIKSVGNGELYDFHETVTSAGTTTINSTEYKLVYFGDWPKTVKENDVSVDENTSVTMGGNTYYLGSDNNYYAKCTENAYSSGYTYSDGTTVAQSSSSSTKYFKVEPITWRVLTENYNSTGKALLLAEDILTANVPYYGATSERTLNSTTIYANNYKYSNIRAYLNGTANQFVTDGGTSNSYTVDWTGKGFLQSAFTSSAQSLIATTTVDNSAASTTDANSSVTQATSYACDDTSDKIFLLSEKEVTTTDYGFDSYSSSGTGNARIRVTTDFAKANYAYQSTTSDYGGWWWLRSPYCNYNDYARDVDYDGSAYDHDDVDSTNGGIVPALSISLE